MDTTLRVFEVRMKGNVTAEDIEEDLKNNYIEGMIISVKEIDQR